MVWWIESLLLVGVLLVLSSLRWCMSIESATDGRWCEVEEEEEEWRRWNLEKKKEEGRSCEERKKRKDEEWWYGSGGGSDGVTKVWEVRQWG